MENLAQSAPIDVVRYVVNGDFNQAVLFFTDGSYLQFEHTSRDNRWVKASTSPSLSDRYCRALKGFRLNAIHLQLYFEDDSDVEFVVQGEEPNAGSDAPLADPSLHEKGSLEQVVAANPLPGFAGWWPMGTVFTDFMSTAIVSQWQSLPGNSGALTSVHEYLHYYARIVYDRELDPLTLNDFAVKSSSVAFQSGQFDALSYAFYRSAFEMIDSHAAGYELPVAQEKRLFTKRVGRDFFAQLNNYLNLELPSAISDATEFALLRTALEAVGAFLCEQGYLRDHFAFDFDLDVRHEGRVIRQSQGDVLGRLERGEPVYALYEMGYPVILPSAVYLYQTMGEAQHHSSRTMEELFDRIGYRARETDDFDPTDYPPDRVVELWEIKRQAASLQGSH